MSAIVSFYLIPNKKCDEFCKRAQLIAKSSALPAAGTIKQARLVSSEEMDSPKRRKEVENTKKVFDYLRKNSQEPFAYEWSGYNMIWVLEYLKSQKNIDLAKYALIDLTGGCDWYLFNKELKDKYVRKLDLSRFSPDVLKKWYQETTRDFEFDEAGEGLMDGILIIQRYLELIDSETGVLMHIG